MLDLTHLKECYQKGEESVEILYEYQEGSEGEALWTGEKSPFCSTTRPRTADCTIF